MADKQISQLPRAEGINITDLFVVSQSGAAMSVSGQVMIRDLATALDGHGGIASIVYTPPVAPSLNGTLTITTVDGEETNLTVTNGRGISSISKTGTVGLVDTYTISYNNGTASTFTVTNGAKGDTGAQTNVWIKWSVNEPISSTDMIDTPSNYIGICAQIAEPTSYLQYKWYKYKGEQGIQGATGDYIEPVMTYGTSTAAATQPSNWTPYPSALSYTAGNFIWKKTQYVLHEAQTTQATETEIIGYIGANGSGSGTVNQITFNGTVYSDDGTGNVAMSVDAADVGAIADPSTKSQNQVLTFDGTNWVAANPSTGNVNTVNNKGVDSGTTNITLYATDIAMSSSDSTKISAAMPVASSSTPSSDISGGAVGTATTFARADHRHPLNVDATLPADLGTAAVGTATAYARRDHVHKLPIALGLITMGTNWTDSGNGYYTQTVTVSGATVTSNSKVDVQPDTTVLPTLMSDGVTALFVGNADGTLIAYAYGSAPTTSITVQCTVGEVLT